MTLFAIDWYEVLDGLKFMLIGVLCLGLGLCFTFGFGASFLRMRRSRYAQVESFPASVLKVTYETPYAAPRVYFRTENGKRRSFESRTPHILAFPEPGTKGTVTCKGDILYSFIWADGAFYQDDPEHGSGTYSDLL